MENNIDQTASGNAAPTDNDGKGASGEIKVDGGSNNSDPEQRIKGLQGLVQQKDEFAKEAQRRAEEAEKKLAEYEFEKLSETEKLQVKTKEAEAETERLKAESSQKDILIKWSSDWSELQKEFPTAAALPLIQKKAKDNPGALGDQSAEGYDAWLTSVREELSETEDSIGKGSGGNPNTRKIGNTNSSDPTTGDLYEGLSPKEKLKRMRENIGVRSNW
jgi:hypothetical protein